MEREEAVDDTPCDYNELELSEGDDEPSLGSHEIRPGGAVSYLSHPIRAWDAIGETYIDGEVDDCDDEESDEPEIGADDEPSLCGINAERKGDDKDREQDLGSFDRMMDQTKSNGTADLKYNTLGGWPVEGGEVTSAKPNDIHSRGSRPLRFGPSFAPWGINGECGHIGPDLMMFSLIAAPLAQLLHCVVQTVCVTLI